MNLRPSAALAALTGSLAVIAASLAVAGEAAGQVLPSGVGSAGLGELDVATASGAAAISANPARLAFPGTGRTRAVSVRGGAGLSPVSLGDVGEWDGRAVPAPMREAWLARIEAEGRERGGAIGELVPIAWAEGRRGIQLSTVVSGSVDLNPDAAELVLFGNAGRTGEGRTFELAGSRIDARAHTTAAFSWASTPRALENGRLAFGVTAKLVIGHAVLVGRDVGSTVDGEPLDARFRFPLLASGDVGPGGDVGLGLDVGAAWESDRLSLGVVVRDLLNTFDWDRGALAYRPGTALVDQEGSSSDFEDRPASEAPEALHDAIRDAGFGPSVAFGAGWALPGPRLRLVASASVGRREDEDGRPAGVGLGVGAELARWQRVPLRAHVAVLPDAFQLGGGASVGIGPVTVDAAGWLRTGGAFEALVGALGVSWGGG